MEYRFSLTTRLVVLWTVAQVALMVLLFVLGVVVGQRSGLPAQAQAAQTAAPAEPAPAREAP